MEMPLTTKNLVRVTSTRAPRTKMARTYTVDCQRGLRVARNLGYKNPEGFSGD